MSDSHLNEAWVYYKELYDVMLNSTRRVQLTSELTQELQKTFATFAKNLQVVTDKFNMEILKESEGENQKLMNSYQFFSNSLLKISDSYRKISLKIKNEVVDPFHMFIDNYRQTNRNIAKKANQMLSDLDKQRIQVNKCQTQYYSSWQKADKSKQDIEKAIEKIQRGGKDHDLKKANDVSLKLRMATEEYEKEYKEIIDKFNNKWKVVSKELENLCILFQYNEESRLSFSKSTIMTAFRVFTEFNQIIDPEIQKKAKDSQELLKGSKKIGLIQSLGKGKLKTFLRLQKGQPFLTYEQSKRKKQVKKEDKNDSSLNIFKTLNEKQRQDIEKLTSIILEQKQAVRISKEFQKVKNSIVQTPVQSFYFIEIISNKVHKMPIYYCKLQEEHFNELNKLFVSISMRMEHGNQRCIQYLYKMINVSMRIMKKKKDKTGQPRQLLCSTFGKDNKIFVNEKLVLNLLDYIKHRGSKKKETSAYSTLGKGMVFLTKGLGKLVGKRQQEQQQQDQFLPIQQLTTLLSSLSVPTDFSLPLVKRLVDGEGAAFEFLKQALYNKQDTQLRQKLLEPKQIRLRMQEKYSKLISESKCSIYVIKMISKAGYLSLKQIRIREVCKGLRNVHKFILFNIKMENKWIRMISAGPIDYSQLKIEVAQNHVMPAVEEIITLDVNRSLHMHSKYLSPVLLQTILRTFAYYNKSISYCQGMNYLAGYLYIKTRRQQQTYILFENLMQTSFRQIFTNEFEALKLKMYQFQRLLNIYMPELSDHFKKQMISSECYIVSWMITLFSSTYQYTMCSHLVDVLWERFIVWGWRQFFRFTLWLFSIFKDELIELSFDKALHFLGELTKSEIFTSTKQQLQQNKKIQIRTIHEQLNAFHITTALLEKLEKQYKMSLEMAKN